MSQSTAELEAAPGDTPTGLESAPTPATSYTSFVLEYGPEPTGMTWAGRDVPLTTPYVWPTPHCPQVSRIVFPNQVGVDNYGTTQVPQIIVDDSWAYDQSGYDVENCFPNDEYDGGSEWNSRYGKYGGRDQYGRYYGGKGEQRWGAVCPQNWTAYDMGMFSSASISGETNNWETWSTAICCPESYTLTSEINEYYSWRSHWEHTSELQCVSWQSESTTIAAHSSMDADVWDVYSTLPGGTILRGGAGTYTESSSPYYGASSAFTYERIRASTGPEQDLITRIWTISEANILRRPFPISWDESHRSTLSPMPPTLTSNMRIPTWTPSMVIEDGKYDREPDLWPWENEFIYETAREREEAAKQKKKDITIGVSVAAGVIVLILAWRLWALARRRRSVKKLRDLGVDSDVQGLRTFFGLPRKGDAEEEVAAAEAIEMKKFEVPLQTQRNESDAAIVRDPATNRTSMEITMVTSRGESVETTRAARSDMEIPLEAERPNAPGRP